MTQPGLFDARARRPPGSRPPALPPVAECQRLRDALRRLGAYGPDCAVRKQDVLRVFRPAAASPTSERVFRRIVAACPGYGIAVLSWVGGYYLALDDADARPALADLRSRVEELRARIAAIEALPLEGIGGSDHGESPKRPPALDMRARPHDGGGGAGRPWVCPSCGRELERLGGDPAGWYGPVICGWCRTGMDPA